MECYRRKISYIYWIAGSMGKQIGYKDAQRIEKKFSLDELERIFLRVKGGTYAKAT